MSIWLVVVEEVIVDLNVAKAVDVESDAGTIIGVDVKPK